jgi:F-type H+-transporting ATPase subunit alpha
VPKPVEEQVAIIFVAGKGLIDSVPTEKVGAFEEDFISNLRVKHADALASIAAGAMSDEVAATLTAEAKTLVETYTA